MVCDGTFSARTQIFFQLHTIHARNNSKTISYIFALLPSKTRKIYDRPFRRHKTMNSLLEMNQIQFFVALSLLQSIQLQQPCQMRALVVVSFICIQTSGKAFNQLACKYSIIIIRSLLFI